MRGRAVARPRPSATPDALARGLGWFSIALGVVELAAPRTLARNLGVEGREEVIATYGLREIGTGIGLLTARDPTPWVWGRVAGDALDLVSLAPAATRGGRRGENAGLALAAVAGVTLLDLICAQWLVSSRRANRPPPPDYSNRSGFPRAASAMRGAAKDFEVPRDFRQPEALRPWTDAPAPVPIG
jgi:hypothetical protein